MYYGKNFEENATEMHVNGLFVHMFTNMPGNFHTYISGMGALTFNIVYLLFGAI